MKSITLKTVTLALTVACVMVSSLASAAVNNVVNSKHNFSFTGTSYAYHDPNPSSTQVCIYCHTPHNAGQTRLLWNKASNSVTTFRLYTSSSSLTDVVRKNSSLSANSPSLLCLGCHDGKTAMNVLHASGKGSAAAGYPAGSRYAYGSAPIVMESSLWMFGSYFPGMAIGGTAAEGGQGDDLTNDHPIGFSYSAVLGENALGLNSMSEVDSKSTSRIRFFGSSNKVECSTCHNPHVDNQNNPSLSPFLVMSNSGSALCLSCHNK